MLRPLLPTKADVYQKLQETTWQEFVLAEGMKKFLKKKKDQNLTWQDYWYSGFFSVNIEVKRSH